MSEPKLSIVIPVKNGMDTLPQVIEGIQKQTVFTECEVVVIDSGSTDGSVAFLEQFPFVRVIPIDPKTFNHGETRNFAVGHCKGDFVYMTVQDAWLPDANMLELMLSHFQDSEVMGVCGRQVVPHTKGMNPHEWDRPTSEPSFHAIHFKNKDDFNKLTPEQLFFSSRWDDVVAMYRTSALLEIPFVKTDFAEDLIWVKNALSKGFKVIHDRRCKVYHYHHAYPSFVYKRFFIVLYAVYKSFGYTRDLSVPFKTYIKIIYRNFKWKAKPYWIVFNIKAKRSQNRAYHDFMEALGQGDAFLDQKYNQVCGVIPQGQSYKKKND